MKRYCNLRRTVYFGDMFSDMKDSLASSAAKSLLASKMERYGKITNLQICSSEKTIDSEFELLGEDLPVSIRITRYRITGKSGKPALVVESVTASRPWLHNLLQDLVVDKPFKVPSIVSMALGKPEE